MALSQEADLERFSLLEQLASESRHEHALRALLAAPTTHPLLRQYFTLQRERKKIENDFFALPQRDSQKAAYEKKLNQVKEKMDGLFSRFENQEAVLVHVLKAHLLIDASARTDGSWVLNAAEGDFDYKKKALPILQTLKERDIGVAYRLEGELLNEEADKRKNFQLGAQFNDSTAKVFAGYDYLAYIKDEALSDKAYNYPGGVPPDTLLSDLKQEITKGNPIAVVKELTYLDNVVNALKDLDPERVEKNKGTFNQGFYDKKLQEIISSAEKIVSDEKLSATFKAIKKALASYNYDEVRKQKAILADQLQAFNRQEMDRVTTTLQQAHTEPLVKDKFKNNVHVLHNYYTEEIDRIQQKGGKKLSKGDQKNIETLRIAQNELMDNYELKTGQHQFMSNHVAATETALARLSHSNPIIRRIEALFSAFKPMELGKSRQAFRERFASMKERLHALQEDNKSPESSIHP
ncbi:hypothetical protein [Legionella taurinensis]|uniref:Uncharacterized protein n=1 Tax=Legionella taurinensis TaxID=70611 RepID=A0A3A5L7R5_9GAMM|nr:hypothetical protein [Legionella taurinensis]RJT49344.1 hypothetical protein D6J04_01455 [Legionella taurinensis]RJT69377.1 hypothetical protein D6J03_01715 [Legionella taurinensis]STY26758.1 Uncharacterised protein [Legionella taurinensis]